MVIGVTLYWGFTRFDWGGGATPAVEPREVTPRGDLGDAEKATIALFREASPSVVFITTLGQRVDLWTRTVTEQPQGTGTGFVWDDAGHIVTNFHVVQNATGAQVTLSDHARFAAELVGVAPQYDLAVLRIKAPADKLKPINIGTSGDLQVGQTVLAIGNPFGLDQTLTTGVVSALGRRITAVTGRAIEDVIQTDAAINPGNSGGPLLDSAGRLIGVNTAIVSRSGSSAGIGFAVPVDTVNRIVPQLIASGKIVRPQIGAVLDERGVLSGRLGIRGALVLGVQPGSAAEKAGLQPTRREPNGSITLGDIITEVDGRPVRIPDELRAQMERYKPGDSVELTVIRGSASRKVSVTLDPPEE